MNVSSKVLPYITHDEDGNEFPNRVPNLAYGKPENFPIDNLPDLLKGVATELAKTCRVPVCLPAMSAIGVISGAVGKSVVVRGGFQDKQTRLNLYVVAVAEKGSGKSVIGSTLGNVIMERSKLLAEEYRKKMSAKTADLAVLKQQIYNLTKSAGNLNEGNRLEHQAELRERQQMYDELYLEVNRDIKLWIDNSTSEALAKSLVDNEETLFTYSPEAGGAIKVILGKYTDNKSDIDLWLNAYSGDPASLDRKGSKSVQLAKPCISILWMVQRMVIRDLIGNAEVFSRGFTARCLIFDSEARKEYETGDEGKFTLTDKWNGFINKVLDDRLRLHNPREIGCVPEAAEVFRAFENETIELERCHYPDFSGELGRGRENAIKIAGILAILIGECMITKHFAESAVEVARWCIFNYLSILQLGRLKKLRPDLDRVLEVVIAKGGELKIGQVESSTALSREEINNLARLFSNHLKIVSLPRDGVGRPSVVVRTVSKSSKFDLA